MKRIRCDGWRGMQAAVVAAGWALSAGAQTATEAPEVLVTATRTEHGVADVPASAEVIDADQVRARMPGGVADLFRGVAGVDIQGGAFPGDPVRLNLRGLTPGFETKRVLVLMDGRRINEQYQGNVEFSLLPADGIERIEVLRGPASALYGSNAEGGVVNIVTRRGRDLAAAGLPATWVRVAGGSYETWLGQFSTGGQAGPLDGFASGSYVDTRGFDKTSDGRHRDWTAYSVQGNGGVQLSDRAELRVFGGGYAGEGNDENSWREAEKNFADVVFGWNWGRHTDDRLTARVYRNGEHQRYEWTFPGVSVYEQDTWVTELQQSMWLGERNLVTAGVESRRDGVEGVEVATPLKEHSTVLGLYAQDEMVLGDTVRLTAGLRRDDDRDFGQAWSPRVGILWTPTPATDLYGSVNRAFLAPSLSDRYVRTEFNGFLFEGNPDLDPETLTAYEVGCRRRFAADWSTALALFYNDVEDSFDFMMDPDGVFRIRNVTRMKTYGAEAGARGRVTERWSVFANYTYTDGEYLHFPQMPGVEGNRPEHLAPHKANAGVQYATARGSVHALACRAVSSRYGDAQNSGDQKMDGYATLDWRSRVALRGRAMLTLGVDNLPNNRYEEYPGREQPGRNYRVGLETAF